MSKTLCTISIGSSIQIEIDERGSYGTVTYGYDIVDGITGLKLGVSSGSKASGEIWAISTWSAKLRAEFVKEVLSAGWVIHLTEVNSNGRLSERSLEP